MQIKDTYFFQRGQAMLVATVLFMAVSLTIIFGLITPILNQKKIASDLFTSRQSYFLAEAAIEDVAKRLQSAQAVPSTSTFPLNGGTVTITVTDTTAGKQVTAVANVNNTIRKISSNLSLGTGVSFYYGVQSGMGGFILQNSSSITGNVYSGGAVNGVGNMIYGDVVSSGISGLINGVHATGSAYAHNIKNSTIDKNAYYQTIFSTTVGGTSYPGTPDAPDVPLPISDAQIADWEAQAAAGGTMTTSQCDTYTSSSNTCTITTSKTLGPLKIPFNLFLKSSSGVLTVAGPLWITGNITTQTGPTIRILPSLGNQNVAIIADNPSDRTSSGLIDIGQSTIFQGSGHPLSFVFLISQNNDAEANNGSTPAISMSQGASATVAYASHGLINLSQSVSLKEVTGYKIVLSQSANVSYNRGLPNIIFSSGPSGGYSIINWQEY